MRRSQLTRLLLPLACMGSRALVAQSVATPAGRPLAIATMAALRQMEDSLVGAAVHEFSAIQVPVPSDWPNALKAAEQLVGRPWRGLPATVLLVPDDGRGFFCGTRRCLGLYLGSNISMPQGDSTSIIVSSIVLVAQSAVRRPGSLGARADARAAHTVWDAP